MTIESRMSGSAVHHAETRRCREAQVFGAAYEDASNYLPPATS